MLSILATTSEIALRGRTGGDAVIVQVARESIALSVVPLPLLVGLGFFLLSASAVIIREVQKERATDFGYSAARF